MTALAFQSDTLTDATPAVCARRLSKSLDERQVLRQIDLDIPRGQCTALLGINGAGKSTLLRILALLTQPSAGELALFGRAVRRDDVSQRIRIGMIAHQPMLYRDLSVRENLLFFGKLYGVADAAQRADHLLERVALADRAGDAVKTLSRGMNQRVAIARALMHDPDLLLADEPFAGLDVPATLGLEALLNELRKQGKTVLVSSHDVHQSLRLAQHVVLLRGGRLGMNVPAAQVDSQSLVRELVQ